MCWILVLVLVEFVGGCLCFYLLVMSIELLCFDNCFICDLFGDEEIGLWVCEVCGVVWLLVLLMLVMVLCLLVYVEEVVVLLGIGFELLDSVDFLCVFGGNVLYVGM